MADNGIIIIGSQTIGYTERNVYVYWDIASDMTSERSVVLSTPYYLVANARYTALNYMLSVYATRWVSLHYQPTPITERKIFMHYSQCMRSDRSVYYHPETGNRLMFVEGLLTNTPLLMKYPKYFNWSYVPQILNPEFILWSYYDLAVNDITVKLVSTNGVSVRVNSGTDKAAFTIETLANHQFKITANIAQVFEPGDTVNCYVTAYDVKGNYLKPGMW